MCGKDPLTVKKETVNNS